MTLLDDVKEQIINISEGNPGALTVLLQLVEAPEIITYLELHGPKGSNLWVLYKDRNFEDINLLAAELSLRMQASEPELYDSLIERALQFQEEPAAV